MPSRLSLRRWVVVSAPLLRVVYTGLCFDFLLETLLAWLQIGPLTEGRTNGPMRICGLSRAVEKDIHRCWDAVPATKPVVNSPNPKGAVP